MTKQEKQRKIERLEKRLKRFGEWVEYYKPDSFVKLMHCSIKARVMANEIITIASQPTDEMMYGLYKGGSIPIIK
jgi:hypothetical protein